MFKKLHINIVHLFLILMDKKVGNSVKHQYTVYIHYNTAVDKKARFMFLHKPPVTSRLRSLINNFV